MIMCIQNLVLIALFVFRKLSKNSIQTSIKGRNSVANLPKFELIQAFMHVLVTCKNEEDQIKMKVQDCSQDFSHYKSIFWGDFSGRSRAANCAVFGRIWLKFELVRDIMVVLLTCKNKEDSIKNEGARVVTTLYIDFFRRPRADNSGVGGGI